MGRSGVSRAAGLGLAASFGVSTAASAQSVNVPLQFEQAAAGTILVVNVGIDGQAPRPYLFDTGSSQFNAYYSASAFDSVPESMASSTAAYPNGLPTGVMYRYGDTVVTNTFVGNVVATPSLTFYAQNSQSSPSVTLNATTSGASSNFLMTAVTSHTNQGVTYNISEPLGAYGSFGGYYGIFGADTVASSLPGTTTNTSSVTSGSVLGQAVVPGASAGYVVAANGTQAANAVTACNPCVILGLTPAVLAQFKPVDTLTATATGTSFPNSGAKSLAQYGIQTTVTLTGPQGSTASYTQPTLFDTGTADNVIKNKNLSGSAYWPAGSKLTISDGVSGSTTTTYSVKSPKSGAPISPYAVETANGADDSILGIGFFMQNSVLFNLAGQAIGYTPNFVTDANLTTTSASPLVIGAADGPLGLAGVISGPGGVSITSSGSATLSGTNTYTGATTVAGGKLALVGPGSIAGSSGVNLSADGVFDISGATSGVSIASLSGADQPSFKFGPEFVTLLADTVALGANTLTLTHASGDYAGAITGSGGLTLTGGQETLETFFGTDSYSGPTTIDGGRLTIEGTLGRSSNVAVNAGGELAGLATIDSTVAIARGGVLEPGMPGAPGAMQIFGNLSFAPGAYYVVGAFGAQASETIVNGSATLGGATVVWAPRAALGKVSAATLPILAATNLSGAFNPLVAVERVYSAEKIASQGGPPTLSYAGGDVMLSIPSYAITLALPSSAPGNAQNVAGAINASVLAGETVPLDLQYLMTQSGGALNVAANQLGGQPGGAFAPVGFLAGDMLLNMALNPFADGRDSGFGPNGGGTPELAYAEDPLAARAAAVIPAGRPAPPPQFTAWGASYGGVGSVAGDAASGAAGVTSQIVGFAAGVDDHVAANAIVGLALGGGVTNWQLDQGMGSGQSGMAQAAIYGSSHSGPAYLSGALAYAWHDVTTSRVVTLTGSDKLDANFDANVLSSRLEGGYRLPTFGGLPAGFGVTPYAAVQAQGMFLPAYSEYAAPGSSQQFALSYAASDDYTVRTELGAWFDADLPISSGALKFYSRAAWAHDFDNESTASAFFQQLPGSSFLINTAKPAPNSALITAGLEYRFANGWSVLAKFDGDFASTTTSYAGSAVLQKVW